MSVVMHVLGLVFVIGGSESGDDRDMQLYASFSEVLGIVAVVPGVAIEGKGNCLGEYQLTTFNSSTYRRGTVAYTVSITDLTRLTVGIKV